MTSVVHGFSKFSLKYKCFILRDGVNAGIDWVTTCVQRNSVSRPPTQKDIT